MFNPWTQGRVSGVRPNPTLGAWLNRRKQASAAYVPPQWARLSLENAHLYWYQFPLLVLGAAQTNLTRVTVAEDFWLVAILANGTSGLVDASGTFRIQVYEDQNTYKYSKYGVNQSNFCPLATEPGLIKMPHFIRGGSPVNCRVQNLDGANANNVSVALFGYSSWWRE